MLIHLDIIQVNFNVQCHRSKIKVTGKKIQSKKTFSAMHARHEACQG